MTETDTGTRTGRPRPSAEELAELLLQKSAMEVAEDYGVSRTTVCVWASEDLGPNKARELWQVRRKRIATDRAELVKVKRVAHTVAGVTALKYSDQDIYDAMLAVADGASTLTASDYAARRDKKTMPSAPAIMRRFGTWNEAVKAAGLTPVMTRGRPSTSQVFTGLATTVAYLLHCYKTETKATFKGVKQFALERGVPTTAVARGRWSDLKAEALRRWDEFTDEPKFWEGHDEVRTETGRVRWDGDSAKSYEGIRTRRDIWED